MNFPVLQYESRIQQAICCGILMTFDRQRQFTALLKRIECKTHIHHTRRPSSHKYVRSVSRQAAILKKGITYVVPPL